MNNKRLVGSDKIAQEGVLDLTDWELDSQPIHLLDGEWLFYQDQFISPNEEGAVPSGYIMVPGLWNSFQNQDEHNDENMGPYGYGTYKLKVLLPTSPDQSMAIKVPDMSSSYRLYIDGELVSSNGSAAISMEEEMAQWKPLVKTIGTRSDYMEIVVHVSNFHHMKGGMWESILLGTEEAIVKNRELNLMMSFILVGVLFISAFYYLIIFSVMQSNMASLYLALFCIMAGIRELLIREVIISLVIPDISFSLVSKLEYMTVPSGPLLLALSLYSLYRNEFSKRAIQLITLVFSAYILIIIFTPLRVFGHLMNTYLLFFVGTFIYLIWVIALAAWRKRPGAALLLFGTFFILLTALIDMGYFFQLHNEYHLAYTFSIGLIVFILCQMHSLSLSIADIIEKSHNFTKAELAFLQAQIVPHFLYNTLSTVIYLTREQPEKARNLLMELSQYLRGKFNFDLYNQNKFVPLEYELGVVKSYLSIEKVRFNEHLDVIFNIDEQALYQKILPFTLQPLVENAIKHGLKGKSQDCKIIISATCSQGYLHLSVEDNGMGMPKAKILSIINASSFENGTGLFNVNQRLVATYGAGISISSSMNMGTNICMKIPLKGEKIHAKSYAN